MVAIATPTLDTQNPLTGYLTIWSRGTCPCHQSICDIPATIPPAATRTIAFQEHRQTTCETQVSVGVLLAFIQIIATNVLAVAMPITRN
jgi:hypothetical protein